MWTVKWPERSQAQIQDLSQVVIPEKTAMTQEAANRDTNLGVGLFKVSSIYGDPEFNCRGTIAPIDVVDLAKSIAFDGLLQPVVITPRRANTPPEFDYALVAGHRRHMAYIVNNYPVIPAVLRNDLDEFAARTLNFKENLKRQDLTILQEAHAIKPYIDAGWGRSRIAEELGVSGKWVQARTQLLTMPEPIQDAAASGLFTQSQLDSLYSIKDEQKQLSAAKMLKEAKERGEKGLTVDAQIRKATRPNQKCVRKRAQMFQMQEEIRKTIGNCFGTVVLAWCAGELSDYEFYEEFRIYAESMGKTFVIPSVILDDIINEDTDVIG
jgi:ParB/RepB/Spo0J family partition protein